MDNPFYCRNGKIAHSLEDLVEILKLMPQDEFSHHVNEFKNDFATWIGQVIGDSELAARVGKCAGREETIAIINETIMRRRVSLRFEEYVAEKGQEHISPAPKTVSQQTPQAVQQSAFQGMNTLDQVAKQEPEKRVEKKEAYKYFTLKEFILGVALGFVLGFVVSKLLFSLITG